MMITNVKIKRVTDAETGIIYLILFSITAVALSNILYFQTGMPAVLTYISLYTRVFLCAVNVIYLLLRADRRYIGFAEIKIYISLFYVTICSVIFFNPGIFRVIGDGFAWPLTYLSFYLFFKNREFPFRFRKVIFFCHIVICTVLIRTVLTLSFLGTNPGPVYHSIAFLPLILLICSKKQKIICSIFSVILVVTTAKRTGLAALIVGFTGYFLLNVHLQSSAKSKFKTMIGILGIGILVFALGLYYSNITENIFQRFENISEDGGTGRFMMWEWILSSFKNSSITNKLFGHGFHAVPNYISPFNKYIFAHNSYIEYLYDLGIIGAILIIIISINMLLTTVNLIKTKNHLAPTAFFAICIMLSFSLTSYFYDESNYILMIACYWGILRGLTYTNRNVKRRDA